EESDVTVSPDTHASPPSSLAPSVSTRVYILAVRIAGPQRHHVPAVGPTVPGLADISAVVPELLSRSMGASSRRVAFAAPLSQDRFGWASRPPLRWALGAAGARDDPPGRGIRF